MQRVCDVLEELLACGVIQKYAIGGATAAGFHGEPLATRDIDVFCYLDAPTDSISPPGCFIPIQQYFGKKLADSNGV